MLAWNKNKLLAQAISSVHPGKTIFSQMVIDLLDTNRFGGLGCCYYLNICLHISMPYFLFASDHAFVFRSFVLQRYAETPFKGVSQCM